MGRMPYLVYLWPGLPTILVTGSWIGLAWAAMFAVLVNLLIVATFWWPELMTVHARNGTLVATMVFWAGATIATQRSLRWLHRDDDTAGEPTFADATRMYLRADWFGAEQILSGLLRNNPRDVEAGLLLATLWRHTGRTEEALRQLDRLELLDGARRWSFEIHQERKCLRELPAKSESDFEASRAA